MGDLYNLRFLTLDKNRIESVPAKVCAIVRVKIVCSISCSHLHSLRSLAFLSLFSPIFSLNVPECLFN